MGVALPYLLEGQPFGKSRGSHHYGWDKWAKELVVEWRYKSVRFDIKVILPHLKYLPSIWDFSSLKHKGIERNLGLHIVYGQPS